MRPELALWLAAGLLVLIGGGISLAFSRPATGPGGMPKNDRGPETRAAAVCAYAGLAALVAGLAWRGWANRAWPGASPAEALLLVAAGALWLSGRVTRSVNASNAANAPAAAAGPESGTEGVAEELPSVSGRLAYAVGLLATGVLILGGAVLGWALTQPVAPQADSWLFGLRSALASLGLGGWLFVCAANVTAVWQGRVSPRVSQAGQASARGVLRAGYPWLTAALLAAGAWQMAAFAAPWRAVPADLWLVVAWLLGGAYLALEDARWARSLGAWPPAALSLAGLASALLAAGLSGSLFW